MLAWDIAFGEECGGEYDYKRMTWDKFPLPAAVLAIPGSMGEE